MARKVPTFFRARLSPRKYSITRIYWVGLVLLASIPTLLLGYFWVSDQYRSFQQQSAEIRQTYEHLQTQFLQREAGEAVDFIEFKSQEIEQRLQAELKSYVDNALLALETQPQQQSPQGRQQLLRQLGKMLGRVRFGAGNDHFLVFDEDGRSLVPMIGGEQPVGRGVPQDDAWSQLIVQLMRKARNSGEAAASTWLPEQAASPNTYSTQIYLRFYPAMNAYVGAVGYEEDMTAAAQAEVIAHFRAQSRNRELFISIVDYSGSVLLGSPAHALKQDLLAAEGNQAGRQVLKAVDRPQGIALKSQRPGQADEGASEYLSYARAAPGWRWIAVASVPIDAIEEQIAQRRAAMKQRIQRGIAYVGLIVVGLLIGATLSAQRLAARTHRALRQFNQVFAESNRQNTRIDIDKLPLTEFEQLAVDANRMLDQRMAVERELIAARISAEEANQAKSQFLSTMSHELRTPLNGVLGYAQILMRDAALSDDQHRHLAAIQSCGEHLLTLINDVLDLAKIESGELEVIARDCHLYPLLSATADVVRGKADAKGLVFTLHIAADVPAHVWLDDVKLRQILINLLGNAVKFTEFGSVTLTVRVSDDGAHLLFEVSDTGIGIDRERIHEIFHPFRQLQTQGGGTGLGLAISRRVCEAMRGDLAVDSALGAGSRFTLTLPLKPVHAAHVIAPAPDLADVVMDLGAEHLRIMVVDDNEDNRLVLSGLLRSVGAEIVEAEHGADALEKLRAQPLPLVLMDVRMPVMDGIEATRRIKADVALHNTVVIAVSATVLPDVIEQVRDAGCVDFITKPIHLRELLQKISLHLGVSLRMRTPAAEAVVVNTDQLPVELRRALNNALGLGDLEAMYQVLQHAEASGLAGVELVHRLRALLDNFDFEALRDLSSDRKERV